MWCSIRSGATLVTHPRLWAWSSYRSTVGETKAPAWRQFAQRLGSDQEKYRALVAEGRGGPTPWGHLSGQIYLGSEDFIAQHHFNRVIRDIPRGQTRCFL